MKNQTRVNEALKKVDELCDELSKVEYQYFLQSLMVELCDIYDRSINETSNYEQDD